MNKKLIALAIAAIAAPAAYAADNEVTLYGQVNVGVVAADHWDVKSYGPNGVSQLRVDDLNTNSRIGLKGEENLGDGLKAIFQIEQGVGPDDTVGNAGVANSTDPNGNGNAFASREGWVGLKGGFGSVRLGRGKSAYQLATENFDLFDAAITLDLDAADTFDAASYRFNNDIKYNYEANGLAVAVDYGLGSRFGDSASKKTYSEDKTANGKSGANFAASVQYTFDPFFLVTAYNNQRALTKDGLNTVKRDNFLLGGGWGLGNLNLGLAYEYNRLTDQNGVAGKQNLYLVNAQYELGAQPGQSTVKAGLIHGDKVKTGGVDAAGSDFDRFVAGWKYGLSKRTFTVVEYGHIDYKSSQKDATTFTVGLMHAF
jgi:predicted porin